MPFARLTPSGMVDARIDVGKKTILVRSRSGPGGPRRALGEFDADDGFDALEAVLPRNDQPQRSAVLVRQHLAVQPDRHERQWMHGLVHAQSLYVGPFEHGRMLTGHLLRIVQGLE